MVNGGGGTDRRTDGRKEGWTDVSKSPLCSTGHRPFGAAAQKVSKSIENAEVEKLLEKRKVGKKEAVEWDKN